jgi:serine/threonine protein kinase
MAKLFGDRWQISSGKPLARNSQAEIFRVIDVRGEYEGEYALKHVSHPMRQERFRREIKAVTTLRHPNVIGIVDDSAFSDATGDPDKQYLVMPIAEGGDLGHSRRVESCKGSLDFTLRIGRQIASAVMAAHDAGVLHRDLKPGNVLFMGLGREIWLSDFGLPLIREPAPLSSPNGSSAPGSFMAPELADGHHLDVPPAVDVFSLGKVLYFMFSGGVVLPGEHIVEPQCISVFQQSKRAKLLCALLQQMVCPLAGRIKTMPEVTTQLEAIGYGD